MSRCFFLTRTILIYDITTGMVALLGCIFFSLLSTNKNKELNIVIKNTKAQQNRIYNNYHKWSKCSCLSFRMTNGGKSTLSQSLHLQIPNSCIIAQDSYFKVDCDGFFKSLWWFLHISCTLSKCWRVTDTLMLFYFLGWLCGTSGRQWIQAVWQ